jgi:hypothetical protein
VNTSSVGRLATVGRPQFVSMLAEVHLAPSSSPTRRSVPGPWKRRSVKPAAARLSTRLASVAMCSFQVCSGSGVSSRRIGAITSQSASTSAVPSIRSARPGVGPKIAVQLISPEPIIRR